MRLLATVLALAMLIATADGRSRKRRSDAANDYAPGQFDYYLLTLSWAPDWCAQAGSNRNSRECATGRHVGFIVHGLWPQFDNGKYPDRCAPASPVAQDIVNRTLNYIPDAGLIQHEWRDHGTCTGLSSAAYFDLVRRAFNSVRIPDQYKNFNHQITVSPSDVERQFTAANPSFHQDAIRVSCGGGELSEVRICLTKDLHSRACGPLPDCRSGQLTMLPPQ